MTAAIEDVRKAAETAVKPEVPAPPPPPPAGKIGVLQSVSGLGIYVKLELDVLGQLSKGDLLYVFREGKLIGEIIIDNKSGPESKYPFGSLKCDRGHGSIQRGDEVRNKK